MKIPHKCPICDGTGLVSRPAGIAGDQASFSSPSSGPWECRRCDDGIIWSEEKPEAIQEL